MLNISMLLYFMLYYCSFCRTFLCMNYRTKLFCFVIYKLVLPLTIGREFWFFFINDRAKKIYNKSLTCSKNTRKSQWFFGDSDWKIMSWFHLSIYREQYCNRNVWAANFLFWIRNINICRNNGPFPIVFIFTSQFSSEPLNIKRGAIQVFF